MREREKESERALQQHWAMQRQIFLTGSSGRARGESREGGGSVEKRGESGEGGEGG